MAVNRAGFKLNGNDYYEMGLLMGRCMKGKNIPVVFVQVHCCSATQQDHWRAMAGEFGRRRPRPGRRGGGALEGGGGGGEV